MSSKESKAAAAKEKYNNNKEAEQRRKFIYRIKQGNVPNLTSMSKYGLTLETINDLRKEVKLKPLNNTDIRGQLKKKMEMMITNEEDVLKSVIPNVHMFNKKEEQEEVKHMNEDTKITLDIYIECLSHKVGKSSINLYKRLLTILLKTLKYKDGDSIVDYLQNYKRVQSTIENLRQTTGKNVGELYSLGTKKLIYQAISTGLCKDTCPIFEKQMGKEAKKFYNFQTEKYNNEDKSNRRKKTETTKYKDWNDIVNIANNYINDTKSNLEDKAFVQVYVLLGGVPRTGTFLKLHVVKNKDEANDKNKNYYISNKKEKILLSNNHKTGVNDKKKGQVLEINLKKQKDQSIYKNLDKLAKTQDIIFNKQQTDTSKMIKYIFGVTNTEMRHSNETYNNNTGDIDVITTGYKINAHSSATAHDFYTEKNTTVKKKKK
jgi:hypothetical protein